MLGIEFVGTSGQSSIVAAKLLADAAVKAGYNSQAFASHGGRRHGGESESYIRLVEGPICYISWPDVTISLDSDSPSFNSNKDICKSCGICICECPQNAIS